MGLGKTLQTLVGIGLAHSQRKGTGSSNGHSKNDRAKSLVVCPSTLCGHWKNEINKFFLNSNFYQVLRHDGNKRKRQAAWDLEINSANIVVTSYAVLRQDIETISSVMWTYCILDEGHLLKNPKTGESTQVCTIFCILLVLVGSFTKINDLLLDIIITSHCQSN